TGSGKSVILDSINFVLGSKADKNMIRYGENEASVKAEFCVDCDSLAAKAIDALDIECDGEIIITRRYNVDGKGSIKINGNTVTASMLKSVTAHLVDVHGQSEHFFLLNEANQLKVVDELCGNSIIAIKSDLSKLILEKREIKSEINSLGGDEHERARKLDLLSYQISEIEAAEVKEGEYEQLKSRQNIINNVEKILNALNAVKSIFSDDGGCTDLISMAQRHVSSVSDVDEEYENIYTRLENLNAEAEDISETVSDLADELNFDGNEAQLIDERLTLLKNLRKKYGSDEGEIIQFLNNAKAEYDRLSDCEETIAKCRKKLKETDGKIYALCKKLTGIRKDCSGSFCKNVENQLKSLNIPNASFSVQFNDYDESSANLNCEDGSDEVSFMFSANKGEPLKPLNKVISGGEMSRFMLAIKTQLKGINGISTYIFDEIDAGISGLTARAVAEKFIDISKNTQILAVSHLPQVCAASDAQFLIYKIEEADKTVTKVKKLSNSEKIDEVLRLTGGNRSEAAVSHAKELIAQFHDN
ncbi:MAG: DNA repair protein RecN, partial [Candidatus Coproplasma sp.]